MWATIYKEGFPFGKETKGKGLRRLWKRQGTIGGCSVTVLQTVTDKRPGSSSRHMPVTFKAKLKSLGLI